MDNSFEQLSHCFFIVTDKDSGCYLTCMELQSIFVLWLKNDDNLLYNVEPLLSLMHQKHSSNHYHEMVRSSKILHRFSFHRMKEMNPHNEVVGSNPTRSIFPVVQLRYYFDLILISWRTNSATMSMPYQ